MDEKIIEIKPSSLNDLALFRDKEEERACYGKYIAIESSLNEEVIRDKEGKPVAHDSISETYEEVQRIGYEDPLVFFYAGPDFRPGRIPKVFFIPISKN